MTFPKINAHQLTFLDDNAVYALPPGGKNNQLPKQSNTLSIMGLDPARTTGYCVIHASDEEPPKLICYGELLDKKKKIDFDDRLPQLIQGITRVIKRAKPDCIAIEKGYMGFNRTGSLNLAEIRGLYKTIAILHGIPYFTFQPSTIRKVVCGNGKATKPQVKDKILKTFPHLKKGVSEDITDAIATGLCLLYSIEKD